MAPTFSWTTGSAAADFYRLRIVKATEFDSLKAFQIKGFLNDWRRCGDFSSSFRGV
ncbi:hypothetical protein KIN_40760 [Litoreibacter roseus]|uniref:Uncharacterized protein n=1 Tax=Litoreibacter roseus TaxID=2601869 RepID=A0A6N6JNP8_9RHOB|nr:hypothetical protein KIN_40760 [Litoreibacter roseus]